MLISGLFLLGVLPVWAQMPQQPGAPSGDISNLSRDVINTADRVNVRNGPNDIRNGKKTLVTNGACLLPPLARVANATIAAEQLQVPAKAKKEYLQACVDLSKQKVAEAEKHLRLAVHEFGKYSAAWVTLGQVLGAQERRDEARQACSQASSADPKYVPAYLCLADLEARSHAWDEVLKLSQRAIDLDPANDPVAYEYQAAANLNLHHLAEAEKGGLRAVEADKEHTEPRMYFVLAQIYEAEGNAAAEIQQLREYLKYAQNPDDVAAVKKFLDALENPPPKEVKETHRENSPEPEEEASRRSWAPPDIDQRIPPVQADISCPLTEILKETSAHTQDLIESLQRFSADEHIEQIEFSKNGKKHSAPAEIANYVAQIESGASGYPIIKEYRAGSAAIQKASVVDTGSATFALIFHPSHIGGFDFRCEGLANLEGSSVWQLHFEESADPNRSFQAIQIGGAVYLPRLKGRAWVAKNTFEVLRMETDLATPISRVEFTMEHLMINYAPVYFKHHSVRLWLPESTSLYIAYRGHRYERVHRFSHFQLFSVDSEQAVKEPTPPSESVDPKDATSKLLSTESKLRMQAAPSRKIWHRMVAVQT